MFLFLFFTFIVSQRLVELFIANRNTKYLKSLGGYEVGENHYIFLVSLHVLFLISFLIEAYAVGAKSSFWYIPFILFLLAQAFRVWIIASLGHFWNTRIILLPNSSPIKKGPYHFLRHPNYLVVMTEFITIPLIFGAYYTAVIFSLLNIFLLQIRIREEENALFKATTYSLEMKNTPRFFPKRKRL